MTTVEIYEHAISAMQETIRLQKELIELRDEKIYFLKSLQIPKPQTNILPEGFQFREAVKKKRLTSAKVAEALGVSRQTIQSYYRIAQLGMRLRRKIKAQLDIDIVYIKTAGKNLKKQIA